MQKKQITDNHEISVFKIRIDSVKEHAIAFELSSGDRVKDTYVNIIAKGGYGTSSRLILTPKQFSDFAIRLIAYTYLGIKTPLTDEQLTILWSLRLNIFNDENQKLSVSIFEKEKDRLSKLDLIERRKK